MRTLRKTEALLTEEPKSGVSCNGLSIAVENLGWISSSSDSGGVEMM